MMKSASIFLCTILATTLYSQASSALWMPITVSASDPSTPTIQLTIATDSGASDGIDSLDVLAPPAPPTAPYLYAYFLCNNSKLLTDIRPSIDDSLIWTGVIWNSEVDTFFVKWTTHGMPEPGIFVFKSGDDSYDMRTIDSVQVIGEWNPIHLHYDCMFTIHRYPPGPLARIDVLEIDSLSCGRFIPLFAWGYDTQGNEVPIDPEWKVEPPERGTIVPGVMTEYGLEGGVEGWALVIAEVDGIADSIDVLVLRGDISQIDEIIFENIDCGTTDRVIVVATDKCGNDFQPGNSELTFIVYPPDLGYFEDNLFTATHAGEGTITVLGPACRRGLHITVKYGSVSAVVPPSIPELECGESHYIGEFGVFNICGDAIPHEIDWVGVNPPDIGGINDEGQLIGNSAGEGFVHFDIVTPGGDSTSGGVATPGSIAVKTVTGDLAYLQLSPDSLLLRCGERFQLSYFAEDYCGNKLRLPPPMWEMPSFNWFISYEDTTLYVGGVGSGWIKLQFGYYSDLCWVTVTPGPMISFDVSPDTTYLTVGESQQFTADGEDICGNDLNVLECEWWVNPPRLGRIDSTGNFTSFDIGKGWVFAKTENHLDSSFVSIGSGEIVRIEVSPDSLLLLMDEVGCFYTKGYDEYSNEVPINPIWWFYPVEGYSHEMGEVDQNGCFLAGGEPGEGRVVATVGDLEDTSVVMVISWTPKDFTIYPQESTVSAGNSVAFTAIATNSNGFQWDVTDQTIFSTNDPWGSVTENVYTTGEMGDKVVTGTYLSFSDLAVVHVLMGPPIRIDILPPRLVINEGDWILYIVKSFDEPGNVENITDQCEFVTTDPCGTWDICTAGLYHSCYPGKWYNIALWESFFDTATVVVGGELEIDDKPGEMVPDEFGLAQNYPNPFNPETTIKYALPSAAQVRIEIYNTLGQKVATLVNETQNAGIRRVTWNAKNMPAGIYFYRIQTDNIVQTKQMLLLK